MIILQIKDLSKSYGVQDIFSGLSFTLNEGEKVGLIGANGTGKSTILKCLSGEEVPDGGAVIINEQTTVGFLAQQSIWPKNSSLFDEMMKSFTDLVQDRKTLRSMELLMSETTGAALLDLMSQYSLVTERYERAGGYSLETMVKKIINGLGFKDEELNQSVDTMSGGQKTRAALAKVLLQEPDILLLDEPTNHLDISAVEWLEDFLMDYPKTVLLVSHDRYFLDKTITRILELERGKISSYQENYQGYLKRKGEFEESYLRAYQKQQQAISDTEEYIRRYKAGIKSKQARGREKILNRLDKMEKLTEQRVMEPRILTPVPESGFNVLKAIKLSHGFGPQKLFKDLNFNITKGEKVALVGDNGTGKSTILKAVMEEITLEEGEILLGSRVIVGYFSQGHEGLDQNQTVLQEIMFTFNKGQEEARSLLATFLFKGDEIEKRIGDLSGGEKSRVALLKLLLTGANFLVLDEPTNHLDIASKEMVEEYLSDFPGTILVVSHDRYFLDKVVDRTLDLAEGELDNYLGNYSYYRFKKKEKQIELNQVKAKSVVKERNLVRDSVKEQDRIIKQLTKTIENLEKDIQSLEAEKEEVASLMSNPNIFGDGAEIKDLLNKYHDLENNINQSYLNWELKIQKKEDWERK